MKNIIIIIIIIIIIKNIIIIQCFILTFTSVETVSEGQISEPTTAQYRTVPLRPYNVTFDPLSIGILINNITGIIITHNVVIKRYPN